MWGIYCNTRNLYYCGRDVCGVPIWGDVNDALLYGSAKAAAAVLDRLPSDWCKGIVQVRFSPCIQS